MHAGEISGSLLGSANSRVKAGTADSADHTRVNNNAVLSGVACGQPIALGKSSVKHAQLASQSARDDRETVWDTRLRIKSSEGADPI